jgi:predicted CXXCH cytochrome family protein
MNVRTLVIAAAVVAVVGVTGPATAQIIDTRHNFANGIGDGEICKPCHTPHNALEGQHFLWAHELTEAFYEMHSQSNVPYNEAFDSRSRLCMSCHDGTVALDAFVGKINPTGVTISGSVRIGTDLTDDHPIGLDAAYPTQGQPGRFNAAHQWTAPWGATYWVLGPNNELRLWNLDIQGVTEYTVGCGTCHTPHGVGNRMLLRMNNAVSEMCLTCHIK